MMSIMAEGPRSPAVLAGSASTAAADAAVDQSAVDKYGADAGWTAAAAEVAAAAVDAPAVAKVKVKKLQQFGKRNSDVAKIGPLRLLGSLHDWWSRFRGPIRLLCLTLLWFVVSELAVAYCVAWH